MNLTVLYSFKGELHPARFTESSLVVGFIIQDFRDAAVTYSELFASLVDTRECLVVPFGTSADLLLKPVLFSTSIDFAIVTSGGST